MKYAQPIPDPTVDTKYTDRDDLAQIMSGRRWDNYKFVHSDGTVTGMEETIMVFYADGTFTDYYDEENHKGVWSMSGERVTMDYDLGGGQVDSYLLEVDIEYSTDLNAYLLILENSSDEQMILTNYEP